MQRLEFATAVVVSALLAGLIASCSGSRDVLDPVTPSASLELSAGIDTDAPKHAPIAVRAVEGSQLHHNIRVNQDLTGHEQNETSIAVNPRDPLNLVAAAKDFGDSQASVGHYVSFDGGGTWQGGLFPDDGYVFETDPVVAFCPDGSAIYVLLATDGIFQRGAVIAYRSLDLGSSWLPGVVVAESATGNPFLDKPWLTCDTSDSIYANRIYVEWMEVSNQTLGQQRLKISGSDDGGQTWSPALIVSDELAAQNQGVLAVGPEGQVYLSWNRRLPDDSLVLAFDRSTDGGDTWGIDHVIAVADSIPRDGPVIRATYPAMDVDRTDGSHRGNVYVAWSDNRHGDPDILLSRSTDGGVSWGAPVRVNDDALGNGADQYHQWITVDPKGRVVVAFWDRRRHIGGTRYEVWVAVSRDGGQRFDTNVVVSDVASDRLLNNFFGDYTGVAASEDWIWPLWVDTRSGVLEDSDIYTDRYPNLFDYDEVDQVAWQDRDSMFFQLQDPFFHQDLTYDIVSGLLSDLHADRGYRHAVCEASLWDELPFVDDRVPPPGDGRYYLVRVNGPDGVGTYGDGAPAARINTRDSLDTTLLLCP